MVTSKRDGGEVVVVVGGESSVGRTRQGRRGRYVFDRSDGTGNLRAPSWLRRATDRRTTQPANRRPERLAQHCSHLANRCVLRIRRLPGPINTSPQFRSSPTAERCSVSSRQTLALIWYETKHLRLVLLVHSATSITEMCAEFLQVCIYPQDWRR